MNSVLWFIICVFVVCILAAGAMYGLYLLFNRSRNTIVITICLDDLKETFRNKKNFEKFINDVIDEMKEGD